MILYHLTDSESYKKIMIDKTLKPGPRNVWVVRRPTGYIRKGGVIWLCTEEKIRVMQIHLRKQGKSAERVIRVEVSSESVIRFNPMPGVYFSRRRIKL
jgi:hypothetical protein